MLEWVVLGAGCALPQPGRGPAAYALRIPGERGVTLFDCGPGTVRHLADAGIELLDIERVVVSHFHTDHLLDLHALAFARKNPQLEAGRLRPLTILGPVGLAEVLAPAGTRRDGVGLASSWLRAPQQSVHELAPGETWTAGGLELCSAPARHSPEALSWRIAAGGASVVFSGDTGEHPGLAKLAEGVDLLVAECAFGPDEEPDLHLNAAAAGRAARDAGAGALLLTHFYPHVDPTAAVREARSVFAGPVLAATDGMQLEVGPGAVRAG